MNQNFQGNVQDLLTHLQLKSYELPYSIEEKLHFPLRATWEWIHKIKKNDPMDPLLLQILPLQVKKNERAVFVNDPLLDQKTIQENGIIHRYKNRALWLVSGSCSIHCQYCFRQFMPYSKHVNKRAISDAIDYLKKTPHIWEVVLSGGDPLTLSQRQLSEILDQIKNIPHIKTVRIHTRQLTVNSEKFTPKFIAYLGAFKKNVVLVTHINHCNEITSNALSITRQLQKEGVLVLNQSVLLKHVNSNAKALLQLSHKLLEYKILPYYLHLLDQVIGSEFFYVPMEEASAIYQLFQKNASGYLLPKMVKDTHFTHKSIYGNRSF